MPVALRVRAARLSTRMGATLGCFTVIPLIVVRASMTPQQVRPGLFVYPFREENSFSAFM